MAGKRKAKLNLDFVAMSKLVLEDYYRFISADPDTQEDGASKIFGARHSAAKTALSHLDQLLKMAAEQADTRQLEEIGNSLAKYRSVMTSEIKEEPDPDDHGDGG